MSVTVGEETTVIDLFSGAGGLSLGFRTAGCSMVAWNDDSGSEALKYSRNRLVALSV